MQRKCPVGPGEVFIEGLKQLRSLTEQRGPQAQYLREEIIGFGVVEIVTGDQKIVDRKRDNRFGRQVAIRSYRNDERPESWIKKNSPVNGGACANIFWFTEGEQCYVAEARIVQNALTINGSV